MRVFPFGIAYFRGQTVSFRECSPVGRLLSVWNGPFSGDMLISRRGDKSQGWKTSWIPKENPKRQIFGRAFFFWDSQDLICLTSLVRVNYHYSADPKIMIDWDKLQLVYGWDEWNNEMTLPTAHIKTTPSRSSWFLLGLVTWVFQQVLLGCLWLETLECNRCHRSCWSWEAVTQKLHGWWGEVVSSFNVRKNVKNGISKIVLGWFLLMPSLQNKYLGWCHVTEKNTKMQAVGSYLKFLSNIFLPWCSYPPYQHSLPYPLSLRIKNIIAASCNFLVDFFQHPSVILEVDSWVP